MTTRMSISGVPRVRTRRGRGLRSRAAVARKRELSLTLNQARRQRRKATRKSPASSTTSSTTSSNRSKS